MESGHFIWQSDQVTGSCVRKIANIFKAGTKLTSLIQTGCRAHTASYRVVTVSVHRDKTGRA